MSIFVDFRRILSIVINFRRISSIIIIFRRISSIILYFRQLLSIFYHLLIFVYSCPLRQFKIKTSFTFFHVRLGVTITLSFLRQYWVIALSTTMRHFQIVYFLLSSSELWFGVLLKWIRLTVLILMWFFASLAFIRWRHYCVGHVFLVFHPLFSLLSFL